jgi:hypothetical protein
MGSGQESDRGGWGSIKIGNEDQDDEQDGGDRDRSINQSKQVFVWVFEKIQVVYLVGGGQTVLTRIVLDLRPLVLDPEQDPKIPKNS